MGRLADSSNTETMNLGTSSLMNIASSGDFTIVIWVNTSDTTGAVVSFRNAVGTSNPIVDLMLGYNGISTNSGRPEALWRGDTGSYQSLVAGSTKNDSVWHAWAYTKTGGATTQLWIDSTSEATATSTLTAATTTTTRYLWQEKNWTDGSFAAIGDRWLNGKLGAFGFWNGLKLSDNAVKAIGRGINPFVFRDSNMKIDMPIWGNDSPESDTSVNDIDGTLTGTVKSSHPPVDHIENYI